MKVEELEVDRLYQSVRSDIINLYIYIMEDMAENSVKLSEYGMWEVSQFMN
jgi:hypothetical protein